MGQAILIIEDDATIAALERDYLEASGYCVRIESDGTRGLGLALSQDFDLVVLDVMLPSLDGMELCRTLRAAMDVPIIMVTARGEDADKIRGLGLGADDYIEKPFSPSVLVARIRAHLDRYARLKGHRRERVVAGPLVIDTGTRSVRLEGVEIDLRNKEYELLLFLVRNKGIVFSRDELYEQVWGLEASGNSSTVAVHVKRLRDRIEVDPGEPRYIQTLRGVGYRFSDERSILG